uniref:NADH dehydrogenase subunit 6 n=1 Tax=Barbronia yunnanensis TaxID=3027017 RepID=UPI0023D888EE|nr:NADH dehydrogenase subunit 6 [Barbronia yunnanensis]WDA96187.1 NADH dehydrogenase subunit 6 [Barbronia yunnanensis]
MFMSLFLLALTSMVMILNTPILLLFMILLMALTISWLTAMMYSAWYSFLIFLIYVGGMMVMFSYFVALSPNQFMKIKTSMLIMATTMTMLSLPMITLSSTSTQLDQTHSFSTLTLYSFYNIPILMLMITILLIMMIMVVKLSNLSKGPLRPFMSYV